MRVYGQSFNYWQRTLTFPLWRIMLEDQYENPTVDDLKKWQLGYKPKPRNVAPIPKLPEYEP
jgi:hypothetical protein